MPIDTRQYDSAVRFIDDAKEGWTHLTNNISNGDDLLRLKAYELYEDIYANRPDHIQVELRGEDDDSVEIYLPTGKKNIEAINRFFAVGFDWLIDPDEGDESQRTLIQNGLEMWAKKQKLVTKVNNLKRYMLMKGDALFHLRAMPWERAGKRVVLDELKPEHYFPIERQEDGAIIGCHIVEVVKNPRNSIATKGISDEFVVRRQTYVYLMDDNGVPVEDENGCAITTSLNLYRINSWDDRVDDTNIKHIETLVEPRLLPPQIKQLPVYHFPNNPPPNSTFGLSEMAGIESIIMAMNQSATDEDLTLITQGLGVYWTDASPPTNERGEPEEWEIGPGSVVRVSAGGNFGRVSGVSTVAPFHEHIKMLDEQAQQALGVPDIAIGMVDVTTAESGIALQLKFGPLLAKCKEKEGPFKELLDEFLEDLINWLIVYENIIPHNPNEIVDWEAQIESVFEDPMPRNKAEDLKNILDIWTQASGVLPVSWLYEQLNDIFGWELDEQSDFEAALEDAKKIAESSMPADPFGAQMGDEFPGSELNNNNQPGAAPMNGQSKGNFAFS